MSTTKQFPQHVLHSTPATIRHAFNTSEKIISEDTGYAGHMNLSSTLTEMIHFCGKHVSNYASDMIYQWNTIQEICACENPKPMDEIFGLGLRDSGVDHNSYIINRLLESKSTGSLFYPYVYPEKYYNRILAVRIYIAKPETSDSMHPRICITLKDISGVIHKIEPCDLTNGIGCDTRPKSMPFLYSNPMPTEDIVLALNQTKNPKITYVNSSDLYNENNSITKLWGCMYVPEFLSGAENNLPPVYGTLHKEYNEAGRSDELIFEEYESGTKHNVESMIFAECEQESRAIYDHIVQLYIKKKQKDLSALNSQHEIKVSELKSQIENLRKDLKY